MGSDPVVEKISETKSRLFIHTNVHKGRLEPNDNEVRKAIKIIKWCVITNSSNHAQRFFDLAELTSVSQEDIIFRELKEMGLLFI
ncbi:MAG: hypothetical protein K9J16_11250 [Melioribacteraceae bacterium]|nr:hypothetical protein [Melioribacteraceae bacterium]MCF8353586.1 hypothetical protein [Melioribacteraceae bacterium]MCF8393509.1 hypothetical protein [Melioribacteraceae bacterium]MCF8419319.1 hypothetical protein [Melioribacteraceae bacterium]